MAMLYHIYYKHTFRFNKVFALSNKRAKEKALAILGKEFNNTDFPIYGRSYNKDFVANRLEDLIENIEKII
jgi:hypothetical protein